MKGSIKLIVSSPQHTTSDQTINNVLYITQDFEKSRIPRRSNSREEKSSNLRYHNKKPRKRVCDPILSKKKSRHRVTNRGDRNEQETNDRINLRGALKLEPSPRLLDQKRKYVTNSKTFLSFYFERKDRIRSDSYRRRAGRFRDFEPKPFVVL